MEGLLIVIGFVCFVANTGRLQHVWWRWFSKVDVHRKNETERIEVFRLEDVYAGRDTRTERKYNEYYRIGLIRGKGRCHYAGRPIDISGAALVFFHPHAALKWETGSEERTGFCCMFSEPFFTGAMKENIGRLPMFKTDGTTAQHLTKEQDAAVSKIFRLMLDEMPSDYVYKYDLLRNYVTELIHFALKMHCATETEN